MALARPPDNLPPAPTDRAGASPAARFEAAGYRDPAAAAREWGSLLEKLPEDAAFRRLLPQSWMIFSRAADPDLALRQWSRWIESLEEPGAFSRAERLWEGSPIYRESFLLLLGVSPSLGEDLIRDWEAFRPDEWSTGWQTGPGMSRRLLKRLPPRPDRSTADADFLGILKEFQRLEEIRIAFLDEFLRLPVEQVSRQISRLADAIIERCLERAIEETCRRFQAEPPAGGFAVLALGKLGGFELNYSSDIDLIFLMADGISLETRKDSASRRTSQDPNLIFTRAAEKVIQLLSDFSAGRPLYRVDTRLRPEGSTGRLVWQMRAALDYYHSQGRTWERQALIRLRLAAGDRGLAARFREEVDAFIFRKNLTEDEIRDLKRLKSQIENLADARGEASAHVKIGTGGIRDVEYIVQYLQLVHGAAAPELKNPNIFEVLESLEKRGLLAAEETDALRRGYRFLRQVEHRIQLNQRLQTHLLPENPADLARIARGLGFETVESFRGHFGAARARIRAVFGRLFQAAATRESAESRLAAIIELPSEAVEEQGREFLQLHGFSNPAEAYRQLRRIAGEETPSWDRSRAMESFRRIAARLLREISQYPDPDRTLANFSDCVATLGARSIFFDLLRESEEALRQMVGVCGHSSYVIGILRSYPGLFDEVIDALFTGARIERQALIEEADRIALESAGPGGEPARSLFEFKHLQILVTAFRDLERSDNLTAIMLQISHIAEAVLHGVLGAAERVTRAKLGDPPPAPDAPPPASLILGLGKLGGEEMNYRSDLDLVFLYRGEGSTSGNFTLQEYYTRLAQEAFNRLGASDPLGALWKTDVRLRPMGSKNLLAVSFDEWRNYFEERVARTWERMAFLRSRAVAGDPGLAGEAAAFVRARLPLQPAEDPRRVMEEIRDMRRRLEESVPAGDIKRGRGGIVDVEFIVQALQLVNGRRRPEVITPNTATGLMRLMDVGLIDPQAGSDLLSAYQFLRWMETRFSLLLTPEESLSKLNLDRLRALIQRIGYRSSGEESPENIFLEELRYHCDRNRHHLERILADRG